jgi:hypothetical protein
MLKPNRIYDLDNRFCELGHETQIDQIRYYLNIKKIKVKPYLNWLFGLSWDSSSQPIHVKSTSMHVSFKHGRVRESGWEVLRLTL